MRTARARSIRRRVCESAAVGLPGLLLLAAEAVSMPYTERDLIIAVPSAPDDAFGWSIDIDSDAAVISRVDFSPEDGVDGAAVFVYRRNSAGWAFEAELKPRDNQPVNLDVSTVAIGGDFVVIGAPNGGAEREGRGYLWGRQPATGRRDQIRVLRSSRPAPYAGFGVAVDIDGNTVVVGASGEAGAAESEGAVHVFQRGNDGWRHQRRITPVEDGRPVGAFGDSVSLDASRLAVGAPYSTADNGRDNAGLAFVFERNQGGSGRWGRVARLRSPQPDEADGCGGAVAMSGSLVAVGCDTPKQIWVHDVTAPTQSPVLIEDPTTVRHGIGRKLDFEGRRLVAGAPAETPDEAGLAFVYDCTRLPTLQCSLRATLGLGSQDTRFGWDVAIDDIGRIAVTGQDPVAAGNRLGAVFVFGEPWVGPNGWR